MIPIAYNNLTSRVDAQALIPEQVSNDLIGRATTQSAVLSLFRHIPVSVGQVRMPVLSALPVAYWVQGDVGLKQTTEFAWNNKYLNIEELAAIVPIPDNVVADSSINLWDAAMPYLVEAVGVALDTAVFFGNNAPASFPSSVMAGAIAAGNSVTEGSAATAGGYFADLDKLYQVVEEDGFDVTSLVASKAIRAKLRSARNSLGDRLDQSRVTGDLAEIDGNPISYAMPGQFSGASGSARAFALDGSQFVVGVRSDITYKILDQAVITDATGAIIYNLPQQDMTALRLTFRVGWQVANVINRDNATESTRYPAGVLLVP